VSNSRKIASIAFTGAAAATMAGLNVAPAFATGGTWTVTPHGKFTSASNSKTKATLHAGTATLTCNSKTAFASGSLKSKSTVTPAHLGTISKATFGSTPATRCTLAGTLKFNASLNHPAQLYGSTYAAGVTKGQLRSISATIHGDSGFACTATIKGKLPGSFNNTTHLLTIDASKKSSLSITAVTGCAGQLKVGQKAYFNATYNTGTLKNVTIVDP
jgi:hypothetical protein